MSNSLAIEIERKKVSFVILLSCKPVESQEARYIILRVSEAKVTASIMSTKHDRLLPLLSVALLLAPFLCFHFSVNKISIWIGIGM